MEQTVQQLSSPAVPDGCHNDDKTVLQNGYHSKTAESIPDDEHHSNSGIEDTLETMHTSDHDEPASGCHDDMDHSNKDHDNTTESVQSSVLSSSLDTDKKTDLSSDNNGN